MIRSSNACVRTLRALLLVVCGGMACTQKYSVTVQTGPRQFRAEWLAVNLTQAWNPDAVKAGGLLVPDLEHQSSAVTLVAAGLELYTFFMPEFPRQPFRLPYSRLPALATPDGQPRSYSMQTPYVVQALRLIDRGNCSLRIPWVTGAAGEDGRITVAGDASQVFPALDHTIQDRIHNTPCKDPNDDSSKDCTSTSRVLSEYQVLFTQRADEWDAARRSRGDVAPIATHVSHDGFVLHLVQRFHGNTFIMMFPVYGYADVDIRAAYALRVGDDGFLGVTAVSVEVGMEGDDTEAARARIAEKFRQDLPREIVAAIRSRVSIPIMFTDDAPDDAWCREPIQGRARAAGILAGMTATKLRASGGMQAADRLVSRLDPARFVAIEGEDHKRRCHFVPPIKRVNVLPGEFDLVLENTGEINATGELYSLLAPPESLWCGQALSDGKTRLSPPTEKVLDGRAPIYAPPPNPITGY